MTRGAINLRPDCLGVLSGVHCTTAAALESKADPVVYTIEPTASVFDAASLLHKPDR